MTLSTKERLISEAASLLDAGGESAVTLRAVAEAAGVSHNAPYRHFKNRSDLLAAVAEQDFVALAKNFRNLGKGQSSPERALRAAASTLIAYARKHPARYRHLFSDSGLASSGGTMEVAALDAFQAFGELNRLGREGRYELQNVVFRSIRFQPLYGLRLFRFANPGKFYELLGFGRFVEEFKISGGDRDARREQEHHSRDNRQTR